MNNKDRIITIFLVVMFFSFVSFNVYALEESDTINNSSSEDIISNNENENANQNMEESDSNTKSDEIELENIELKATPLENGTIHIDWSSVSDANYFKINKYDEDENIIDTAVVGSSINYYNFKDLEIGKKYKFDVNAYKKIDEEDILIAKSLISDEIKAISINFNESDYRKLTSFTINNPIKKSFNLRKLIKEPSNGYVVVQGGATDGIYAYYLMVSSSNNKGRVLKVRISDNVVVARSGIINICHGNGMTYDSKRNRLVVVGREIRRNQVTLIDANKLTLIKYMNVNFSNETNATGWKVKKNGEYYGLAAIAYNQKYDVYVALQRNTHDLLVLDPNFKVIGFINTKIESDFPGLYQAMDMDEKYVYLLLSPYNSAQPNNIILAIDWNSEKLLDVKNDPSTSFIKEAWKCNNDNSGKIDAVIKVNNPNEAENIYHIPNANGKNHFYLSEYKGKAKYHWVTKKVPYKVKWKKVKKKVKWKKVTKKKRVKVAYINKYGEVRYKYKKKKVKVWKYKKKKVWKYKTKYKKVKRYEYHYFKRDGYVYDLGTF